MPVGDVSTLLVWAAATAFTIALFAYSAALARIADAAARPRQAARAARTAAATTTRARAEQRVPALAGAGASSSYAPPQPSPVPDNPTASSPAAAAGPAAPGRSAKAEGIARSTHLLGIALLVAGIALRGVAAGRWPTANMYEFTLVGVLVATSVLAIVQRRRIIAFVGVVVTAIAVLALVLALNAFFVRADAVQPALQSYWLVIHVGVAISATGVFTVAFGTSVAQLLSSARAGNRSRLATSWGRADAVRRPLAGWRVTGPRFAWLEQVPDAPRLEALSFRLNAVGFVLWTFTLIAGSIWAEHAWGRYWNWDPKEVGTFVVWVVYAAYLHARTTRGWSGHRAAYLVFAGYAAVIANFTVVNLFVAGLHSYSGLR
jgi:cytochrome c-type biogenesis protein CcsB